MPIVVGTAVRAKFMATKIGPFGCCWYDGVVAGVNDDGTYYVKYDDGDEEEHVAPKPSKKRPQTFQSVAGWRGWRGLV